MTHSNVDAIYAEYPFLSKLWTRNDVCDAKVRRWDNDFLQLCTTNVYLLDEHGEVIVKPNRFLYELAKVILYALILRRVGESVDDMLKGLGDEKLRRVNYAVTFYSGEGTITLWKIPKGHKNAAEWLGSNCAKARATFCQQ